LQIQGLTTTLEALQQATYDTSAPARTYIAFLKRFINSKAIAL
jgi:hypothetical protein